MSELAKKPLVAQFCTALAWVAFIGGAFSLVGGISDSVNPHVSGGYAELIAGAWLLFSSIIWFLGARAITLLAQIEHNTRK